MKKKLMLTGIALSFIITGFILMLPAHDVRNTPGGRYAAAPGPGAFEDVRIRAAPVCCFVGYVMMIPIILYVPKERRE